jgi:hypothetical protein
MNSCAISGFDVGRVWRAATGRWLCASGALALSLMLMGGLTGCQSMSVSSAQLRVIDASPDAPGIDAYQNTTALAYNLDFGDMTSYMAMTPGKFTLAANRTGTRQALSLNTTSLMPGRQYTAIVGDIAANLQQTLLLDQTKPAAPGQVELRFVNEATRPGPVDVYLVPHSGRWMLHPPVATNLNFGANSGYLTVPAGTYSIHVVAAGSVPMASTLALMTGAQIAYDSGAVRTVVLLDHEVAGVRGLGELHGFRSGVQAIVASDADGPLN